VSQWIGPIEFWPLQNSMGSWSHFGNWSPSGLQFPKWKLVLECEGSFPHTLLHSREHEVWLSDFLLAYNLANPCFGRNLRLRLRHYITSLQMWQFFWKVFWTICCFQGVHPWILCSIFKCPCEKFHKPKFLFSRFGVWDYVYFSMLSYSWIWAFHIDNKP
jgi:hypothetical protein